MIPLPIYWWRVEVDAAGGVISCEKVDDEKQGTARVTYVKGTTRAQVFAKAREWHERHKQYQKTSSRRLADKRKAAGNCRHCDTPICAESSFLCKKHLEAIRETKRRYARGETTPRVKPDPFELKAQHLAQHRLRSRLGEQLPELLAKYDALDGAPSAFRLWLQNEIQARDIGRLRLVKTG